MSTTQLSFATAYSTFRVFGDYLSADFNALGITPQDWGVLTQAQPWRRDQLNRVMRTLTAVNYGVLEVMNIPKIQVPAEFVACAIAATVHPGNQMVACQWHAFERVTGVPVDDLAERNPAGYDPATPEQLFALVLKLNNCDACDKARRDFEERVGIARQKAEMTATAGKGKK